MVLTLLHGYPDKVGKRYIFCGNATGPTSYSQTTGDPVSGLPFNNFFDCIFSAQTVSKTYTVVFYPSGVGPRQTWTAKWYTTSGMTEVANAVNLSAEKVQVGGFGGTY